MTVKRGDKVVMEEKAALDLDKSATVQTLAKHDGENFFGGGTQNGRFIHTGNTINIANESNWVDGGRRVAQPVLLVGCRLRRAAQHLPGRLVRLRCHRGVDHDHPSQRKRARRVLLRR